MILCSYIFLARSNKNLSLERDTEVSEYLAKVENAYELFEAELPRQKLARATYGLL